MLIVHSDRSGITNMDNVCEAVVSGRYIHAYCTNGSHHPIAVYESNERANEVFHDLIDVIDGWNGRSIAMPEE